MVWVAMSQVMLTPSNQLMGPSAIRGIRDDSKIIRGSGNDCEFVTVEFVKDRFVSDGNRVTEFDEEFLHFGIPVVSSLLRPIYRYEPLGDDIGVPFEFRR